MKKLKIYLDTSVINFLFADDAPEYKDITEEFFADALNYDLFISRVVLEEIDATKDPQKKKKLHHIIPQYKIRILKPLQEEMSNIELLAVNYENGFHYPFRMTNPMEVINDD